jgi:hypothetical protein
VILLAGRKRSKEQERLARVQTDARRDDAQYERHTAAEKLREAEEAEEQARRARARAEEHHERAAEVDPDRDDDAAAHDAHGVDPAQNGRQSEYDRERR